MLKIKKTVLALMVMILFGCIPNEHIENQSVKKELQTTLDSLREQYHIPGAVLWVQSPEFSGTLTSGFTDFKNTHPITKNTLFSVGSITKTFISASILKLETEKKLSIHDTLSQYFPEYPRWKDITVEELLNMTSGIVNYTNDEIFINDLNRHFKKTWTADDWINIAYERPDDFKPGTAWSYSNTNYLLLGKIIEKVTHQSVSKILHVQFFNPFKMHETFYEETGYPESVFHHMAKGYYNDVIIESRNLTNIGAASGGMVMSARDLAVFLDRLFIHKNVLPKKQLNEMLKPTPLSMNKFAVPEEQYALGLAVVQDRTWGEVFTFTGTMPTYVATYVCIPNKNVLIIAFASLDRHGDKNTDILYYRKDFMDKIMSQLGVK